MNIARLLNPDEKSYHFKAVSGKPAVWPAQKLQRLESTILPLRSRTVAAPPDTPDREVKPLIQDPLWVDMITNALIVIVIASASYFFISAKAVRIIIEPVAASYSEPSQAR
jgi:hypothetical protein